MIEHIRIADGALFVTDPSAVEQIQGELNCVFPDGYPEYISTLGEGVLADYVRIFPPHRIQREQRERKQRLQQYWFWESGPLDQRVAIESICIGDTVDGDEICFHPENNQRIYILPRFSEESMETGPTPVGCIKMDACVRCFDRRCFRQGLCPFFN